jgi:very-short-patch-repair endonuclease
VSEHDKDREIVPIRRFFGSYPVVLNVVEEIMIGMPEAFAAGTRGVESVLEFIAYKIIKSALLSLSSNPSIELQREIGPFRIDFVIVGGSREIAVEVDGHDWHEKSKEQIARDRRKDRFLQLNGYFVATFTGYEIWRDAKRVEREILQICRSVGL